MSIDNHYANTKPNTASDVLAVFKSGQNKLSKGGIKLANFLGANPSEAALLTSAELAERCGVHASTVVRLAQALGFSGYRELQLLFQKDISNFLPTASPHSNGFNGKLKPVNGLRLHMLGESGPSFNAAAQLAAERYCVQDDTTSIRCDFHLPHMVEPHGLARQIENAANNADALLLVVREHPVINNAVKAVIDRGIPVICLTSDLPSSSRTAYVGSDQFASGMTAGWFCGRMLPKDTTGKVLFVYSVPFRCQLDREQGFRQILRTEYPNLTIEEKLGSNESVETIYEALRQHIQKFGPPAAIYNVSGANIGIGRALEDEGLALDVVFAGHELNSNSRGLLESGTMDLAIAHDFDVEIEAAVDCVKKALQGQQPVKRLTPSQLFTRYNCAVSQ